MKPPPNRSQCFRYVSSSSVQSGAILLLPVRENFEAPTAARRPHKTFIKFRPFFATVSTIQLSNFTPKLLLPHPPRSGATGGSIGAI